MEIRIKDVDFELNEIIIREGKGNNVGRKDVRTTMIYTHVLNRKKFNFRSSLDL